MPKYPREGDSFLGFRKRFWGWGGLFAFLLLSSAFLSGMYFGYNRGYRAAQEYIDEQSASRPDTTPSRRKKSDQNQSKESNFERVITEDEIEDTADEENPSLRDKISELKQKSNQGEAPDQRISSGQPESTESSGSADTGQMDRGSLRESESMQEEESTDTNQSAITGSPSPSYTIQVFSSRNQQRAKTKLKQLQDAGLKASMTTKTINGQEWYRIRIGQFSAKSNAESQAQQLKSNGRIDDYWISRILPDS